MRGLLAPVFIGLAIFMLLPHLKDPAKELPQIGNCYSSPTAMVVEKTKDGYKQSDFYSYRHFSVSFKILDIKIKDDKKFYVVKFFKNSSDGTELYPQFAFYTEEKFNLMLPTLVRWADHEYKICRGWEE